MLKSLAFLMLLAGVQAHADSMPVAVSKPFATELRILESDAVKKSTMVGGGKISTLGLSQDGTALLVEAVDGTSCVISAKVSNMNLQVLKLSIETSKAGIVLCYVKHVSGGVVMMKSGEAREAVRVFTKF